MQDGSYIIGRTPSSGDRCGGGRLDLSHPTVSQRHAALLILQGTYYLADLDSHNGTWRHDGQQWQRHTEGYVDPDERLRFGEVEASIGELFEQRETAE